MSALTVLTYPDPFLRRRMAPVAQFDDTVRRVIADMTETMYAEPGVGLAATQVGIDRRIIVYDVSGPDTPPQPQALVNPDIVLAEGEQLSENEGCLSVPDFRADVTRAWRVEVTGINQDGQWVRIDAEGFPAIVLQHEIDHLDGVLFIDRISRLKRELYKRRVRKQLKQSA
jgi:peptide deformylase